MDNMVVAGATEFLGSGWGESEPKRSRAAAGSILKSDLLEWTGDVDPEKQLQEAKKPLVDSRKGRGGDVNYPRILGFI